MLTIRHLWLGISLGVLVPSQSTAQAFDVRLGLEASAEVGVSQETREWVNQLPLIVGDVANRVINDGFDRLDRSLAQSAALLLASYEQALAQTQCSADGLITSLGEEVGALPQRLIGIQGVDRTIEDLSHDLYAIATSLPPSAPPDAYIDAYAQFAVNATKQLCKLSRNGSPEETGHARLLTFRRQAVANIAVWTSVINAQAAELGRTAGTAKRSGVSEAICKDVFDCHAWLSGYARKSLDHSTQHDLRDVTSVNAEARYIELTSAPLQRPSILQKLGLKKWDHSAAQDAIADMVAILHDVASAGYDRHRQADHDLAVARKLFKRVQALMNNAWAQYPNDSNTVTWRKRVCTGRARSAAEMALELLDTEKGVPGFQRDLPGLIPLLDSVSMLTPNQHVADVREIRAWLDGKNKWKRPIKDKANTIIDGVSKNWSGPYDDNLERCGWGSNAPLDTLGT